MNNSGKAALGIAAFTVVQGGGQPNILDRLHSFVQWALFLGMLLFTFTSYMEGFNEVNNPSALDSITVGEKLFLFWVGWLFVTIPLWIFYRTIRWMLVGSAPETTYKTVFYVFLMFVSMILLSPEIFRALDKLVSWTNDLNIFN